MSGWFLNGQIYDKMLSLYPSRVNPAWALWSSARAAKP